MAGERLDRARLTWRGIPGDRGWAVWDETRHGVTGAKRLPPLRGCRARYREEPVAGAASPPAEIGLPDGSIVATDDPDAPRRLAAAFGRPVSLRSLGAAGSEAAERINTSDESEDTVRALMGLMPGEPMADLSQFPPERLRLLRQGNFFDALPIHLLTRTTLRTLERVRPDTLWDERRFRPNLVVEWDDGSDYPELGWIGR